MIEVKKSKKNNYRFVVKSTSGKTLLKSISFSDKIEMENSLNSIQNVGIQKDSLFERKTNFDGKFLVELKSTEGNTIGKSGFYSSEAGMENGILNITKNLL